MKTVSKLLLALVAAVAFSLAQPVAANRAPSGLPTTNRVPDGGSTISLLGFALLGVAALRRKLSNPSFVKKLSSTLPREWLIRVQQTPST